MRRMTPPTRTPGGTLRTEADRSGPAAGSMKLLEWESWAHPLSFGDVPFSATAFTVSASGMVLLLVRWWMEHRERNNGGGAS